MNTATAFATRRHLPTAPVSPHQVLAEARRRALDLRRAYFVAYVIDMEDRRADAYCLWRSAIDDGWQASLYADDRGWVVKVGRDERLTARGLARGREYADRLVRVHGGVVTGFTVEETTRPDCWSALTARQTRRATAVPAQRAPQEAVLLEIGLASTA